MKRKASCDSSHLRIQRDGWREGPKPRTHRRSPCPSAFDQPSVPGSRTSRSTHSRVPHFFGPFLTPNGHCDAPFDLDHHTRRSLGPLPSIVMRGGQRKLGSPCLGGFGCCAVDAGPTSSSACGWGGGRDDQRIVKCSLSPGVFSTESLLGLLKRGIQHMITLFVKPASPRADLPVATEKTSTPCYIHSAA